MSCLCNFICVQSNYGRRLYINLFCILIRHLCLLFLFILETFKFHSLWDFSNFVYLEYNIFSQFCRHLNKKLKAKTLSVPLQFHRNICVTVYMYMCVRVCACVCGCVFLLRTQGYMIQVQVYVYTCTGQRSTLVSFSDAVHLSSLYNLY